MDEAEYCHRIVLMERGRILATDTPANLKTIYFPQKPVELTFTGGNQQTIAQEMRNLSLGEVSVFGSKLRINITKETDFKTYCQKHKDDFTTRPVDPTLDDVFLKAISGAK
jgi:ABC-type multidrug transport system ATPase subunit